MTTELPEFNVVSTPGGSNLGLASPATALLVASKLLPLTSDVIVGTVEHSATDAGGSSAGRTAAARVAASFLLGLAPATRTAYAGDLRDFATWCEGGVDVLNAKRVDIDAYLDDLRLIGAAPKSSMPWSRPLNVTAPGLTSSSCCCPSTGCGCRKRARLAQSISAPNGVTASSP